MTLLTFGIAFGEDVGPSDDVAQSKSDYFETNVRPLLVQRCFSCHSSQADKREGGLALDSREAWTRGGDRGPAFVEGNHEESLLVRAIRYGDRELQMPPSEKLDDQDILKIELWIKDGAVWPLSKNSDLGGNPSDPIAGKEHWAFRPLRRVPVKTDLDENNFAVNAIDQFVASSRAQAGLEPVADANPIDLLRRASFQLVGLPPTSEHVAEYLENSTYDTFERIVDELLASPEFGRRWGRHWLDLARYADSNGLDENFLFRESWRYRNWVVNAMNADMPYDRFLEEQIAGDLLAYESIEQRDRQRIAAGFLVVGPKVLLGVNPMKQRMDVVDEQLDTIGKTVLGQTLGCARCHDHKFDPVPTSDYYAIAGILASTNVMEQRYMLGEQRVMEQLVGLGATGASLDESYEQYWRDRPALVSRIEKAKRVLELLEQHNEEAISKQLQESQDGFTEEAKDSQLPIEARIAAQQHFLEGMRNRVSRPPAIPPRAMIPTDSDSPSDESIRIYGEFDKPGEKVKRGFLTVLSEPNTGCIPANQSGRIEFGRWLTNPAEPAGHLSARVLVNRIWHHMLGRGIVRTVDNFGRTGEGPTHPELLDYLALEMIENGWSIKRMVRSIVLSRTFALSSDYNESNFAIDPENRLLWRGNRRRLDPESLRDALLLASNSIDLRSVDSTVSYLGDQATAVGANKVRRRTDFACRSIYLPVIRNDLPELFESFDFTNAQSTTGSRPTTNAPTQSLFMLNDSSIWENSKKLARRILDESDTQPLTRQVDRLYQLAIGKSPSDSERSAIQSFIEKYSQLGKSKGEKKEELEWTALSLACQAVFSSSRFQYLD